MKIVKVVRNKTNKNNNRSQQIYSLKNLGKKDRLMIFYYLSIMLLAHNKNKLKINYHLFKDKLYFFIYLDIKSFENC